MPSTRWALDPQLSFSGRSVAEVLPVLGDYAFQNGPALLYVGIAWDLAVAATDQASGRHSEHQFCAYVARLTIGRYSPSTVWPTSWASRRGR